jgi:hypothetical protein
MYAEYLKYTPIKYYHERLDVLKFVSPSQLRFFWISVYVELYVKGIVGMMSSSVLSV